MYNLRIILAVSLPTAIPTTVRKAYLTTDESEAVGRQNLVNGLEVGCATTVTVAGASGSDSLGLGARVEGTARVTGFGADTGLGEASDTSFSVGDGRAQGADGAAEDTSGGAGAADACSRGGSGAARYGKCTTAVVVDSACEGISTATADVAVVTVSWKD